MAKSDYEYTFTGKLSDDCLTLKIDHGQNIARILYPFKEDKLEITIKKFYHQRSIAQNSWIWGVCIPTVRGWMRERTGSAPSAEALSTDFRIKIIGEEPIIEEVDGVDVIVLKGKRFSQCTTIEFSERVEKIVAYYAERGLEIPLPQPKTNNYISDYSNYMANE